MPCLTSEHPIRIVNELAVERQSIEDSQRHALDRNELLLHQQPKIDLQTGAIVGAKALTR